MSVLLAKPGYGAVCSKSWTAPQCNRPRNVLIVRPVHLEICASCSSGRHFTYSFLQTSPRGDALAVQLTVPITRVRRGLSPPSHRPDTTPIKSRHAWRTKRKAPAEWQGLPRRELPQLRNASMRDDPLRPRPGRRAARFAGVVAFTLASRISAITVSGGVTSSLLCSAPLPSLHLSRVR